jgi:hypothetical protein
VDTGPGRFEQLHELDREFAESQFRLPRPLRYHIPNTVSIGVSAAGFPAETIEYARKSKLRSHLDGGEKNSTYLLDLAARRMYTAGLEVTPTKYGRQVSPVNPTNRVFDLMKGLSKELFAR